MSCPICLEEESGWKGHVTSHCGHTVCYPCFSRLRKATENPSCPLCRAKYSTPSSGAPCPITLRHAARLSTEQGKPVSMAYFTNDAFLGIESTSSTKVLVNSIGDYSTQVQRMYKTPSEYIIVTENTVYIVPGTMCKKMIRISGTL